jgi:hypothetical protein
MGRAMVLPGGIFLQLAVHQSIPLPLTQPVKVSPLQYNCCLDGTDAMGVAGGTVTVGTVGLVTAIGAVVTSGSTGRAIVLPGGLFLQLALHQSALLFLIQVSNGVPLQNGCFSGTITPFLSLAHS